MLTADPRTADSGTDNVAGTCTALPVRQTRGTAERKACPQQSNTFARSTIKVYDLLAAKQFACSLPRWRLKAALCQRARKN